MALRAGSVGLGREAGLGARRGWTRRRRPPHARGALPRPGPLPRARVRVARAACARPSPVSPPPPLSPPGAGCGEGRAGPSPACAGALPRVRRARGVRRASGRGLRAPGHPGGRRRRRLWTRAGPFPWIAPAAAGVAAALGEPGGRRVRARARPGRRGVGGARRACRPSSPSPPAPPRRGAWARGLPPPGPPPGPRFRAAPRLGRRLAADLELVRTRGIRLFN